MAACKGEESDWLHTPEAGNLFAEMNAAQADEKICERQAKSLKDVAAKPRSASRRGFIELITTSSLGLGITFTGAGMRNTDLQSRFREAIIEAYNAHDPDPKKKFLWCPILKTWVIRQSATAAHLFAYMHGQNVMGSIFGATDQPELFSPLNCIIISSIVEEKFDLAFMVIVPRLPENPSTNEVSAQNASNPKEYKIRIMDTDNKDLDDIILPNSTQTWRDLDGTNVEFRSDFRPRARYLYFHYCLQILQLSWRQPKTQPGQKYITFGEAMKKDFGKHFWGTPGWYLPRKMLLAFVEEMGHGYEQLLEGAMEDGVAEYEEGGEEDREILLVAAIDQVKASANKANGVEDDESDDESDGDDGGSIYKDARDGDMGSQDDDMELKHVEDIWT